MNRQATQFWVAVIGMSGMVGITGIAVTGTAFGDVPLELTFALVTGLVSVSSMAAAWLFRLNGSSGG